MRINPKEWQDCYTEYPAYMSDSIRMFWKAFLCWLIGHKPDLDLEGRQVLGDDRPSCVRCYRVWKRHDKV